MLVISYSFQNESLFDIRNEIPNNFMKILCSKNWAYSHTTFKDSTFVVDSLFFCRKQLPNKLTFEKCNDLKELKNKASTIPNLYEQRLSDIFHNYSCRVSFFGKQFLCYPISTYIEKNSGEISEISVLNQYLDGVEPPVQGYYNIVSITTDTLVLKQRINGKDEHLNKHFYVSYRLKSK